MPIMILHWLLLIFVSCTRAASVLSYATRIVAGSTQDTVFPNMERMQGVCDGSSSQVTLNRSGDKTRTFTASFEFTPQPSDQVIVGVEIVVRAASDQRTGSYAVSFERAEWLGTDTKYRGGVNSENLKDFKIGSPTNGAFGRTALIFGNELKTRDFFVNVQFKHTSGIRDRWVKVDCIKLILYLGPAPATPMPVPTTVPITTTLAPTVVPTTADPCMGLLKGTKDFPFNCNADFDEWKLACGADGKAAATLPSASNKMATLYSLEIDLSRCPDPSSVAVTVSGEYELFLSDNLRALLSRVSGGAVPTPSGRQTLGFERALKNARVSIPVWPAGGLGKVPAGTFTPELKIGFSVVFSNARLVGAQLAFDVSIEACAGLPDCETLKLASLRFGVPDPCCLPERLLCEPELFQCGLKTTTTTAPPTDAAATTGTVGAIVVTDAEGRPVTNENGNPATIIKEKTVVSHAERTSQLWPVTAVCLSVVTAWFI